MKFIKPICGIGIGILLVACTGNSSHSPSPIAYPHPLRDSLPVVFLPGIVSKDSLDFNASFSADGNTFFFSRSHNRKYAIYVSVYHNNKWQPETISPLFDTLYSNTDPFVAYDSAIYFISNRPKDNRDTIRDYDIYRMKWLGSGYGTPEYLANVNSDSTEYYVSVSGANNIYFSSYRNGNLDLYMSKKTVDGYTTPVNLGTTINTTYDEHDPLIAPDESFLVFASDRPGGLGEADLYISYKVNNEWTHPVPMGHHINTKRYEYCPYLSPDGKYFFFSSEWDIKWVGSNVLKQ